MGYSPTLIRNVVRGESTAIMNSQHLIRLLKTRYLNRQGLLSATYPPSQKHLLADLDDYIPFLLHFGEEKFVKGQILKGTQMANNYHLVTSNGRIISYSNNEFVGGIARYYKRSLNESVKRLFDKAMEEVRILLTRNGVITSYYNTLTKVTSPITAPISGGLIEVLIENADIYPELGKIAFDTLDMWISVELFERHGLFPSRYHTISKLWNKLFSLTRLPIPLKIQNRLGVNFFMQGTWNNLIYCLPVGIKVQTAKDNTNMVFALIEAFRKVKNEKYKNAIKWWIKNFSEKMMIDGKIHRFWQLHGKPKSIELDHVFPVLDILCDTYFFVEKDESYLELAKEIIEVCLNEIRWEIGLFPKVAGGNKNHLDIQTDFIVSLRRIHELRDQKKYRKIANSIFKAVLKYHSTPDGFVTSVNKEGKIRGEKIEPKYNALLLKAFVLVDNQDFKIYSSDSNHALMKDR